MRNISLSEILRRKDFNVQEITLWSILSRSVEAIKTSDLFNNSDLILITPDSIFITNSGDVIIKPLKKYDKIYFIPNLSNLKTDWKNLNKSLKIQVLLFSLGITLKNCIEHRRANSSISQKFKLIVAALTDQNKGSEFCLRTVEDACSAFVETYSPDQTFKDHLIFMYEGGLNSPLMMRSISTSSLKDKNADTSDRNNSLYVTNKIYDFGENKNLNGDLQHNDSSIFSSNTSDSNCSHQDCRKENVNINLLNSSNKLDILAAMERAKAQRKAPKYLGPVKPSVQSDLRLSLDMEKIEPKILTKEPSRTSFTEVANIERLDGTRRLLGPEFIIRKNETFNTTSNVQKKNSILFNSGNGPLPYLVHVHLLNGVTLIVRNLCKLSVLSHVINSIHGAYPDLEFVNYGLCFNLDNEYFYLKEDMNVMKLADYVIRKSQKIAPQSENKKTLNLYYRIKFYPTNETIDEIDSLNQRLLYLQSRYDLLIHNKPPISMNESFVFAGIAMQAEHGDNSNNLIENPDYLTVDNYFNSIFIPYLDTNNDEVSFLNHIQEPWAAFPWEQCQKIFIEKILDNKYYGMHWYRVNKNQFGISDAIGKFTFLAISRDSIQLLDSSQSHTEIQIHKHFSYKWKQIESITIKQKKLIFKPKMQLVVEGFNANNAFICYLDSKTKAEHIVGLCNEHHLLASQVDLDDNNIMIRHSRAGSHRSSLVSYPSMLTMSSISLNDSNNNVLFSINHSSQDEFVRAHSFAIENQKSANLRNSYADSNILFEKINNQISAISYEDLHINNTENVQKNSNKNLKVNEPRKSEPKNLPGNIIRVDLKRNYASNESFGIGIIKVKDAHHEGIFIKRILKGSPTDKCGQLQIGDEILFINDKLISKLSQKEVADIIQNSGESVKFLIKKKTQLKNLTNNITETKTLKKTQSFTDIKTNASEVNHIEMENGKKVQYIPQRSLQNILKSKNAFSILKLSTLDKVFPIPLSEANQTTWKKLNLENYVSTEKRKIQEEKLSNSNNLNDSSQRESEEFENKKILSTYHLKIQINKIIKPNTSLKNKDLMFTIFQMDRQWDLPFWKSLINNEARMIILFDPNQKNENNSKLNLSQLNHFAIEDKICSVTVEETHKFSKWIIFYRLVLKMECTKSLENTTHRMVLVNFSNWEPDTDFSQSWESLVKATNFSCGLNENLSNPQLVTIVTEKLDSSVGMFVTLYSLILMEVHRKLLLTPIINNQTIIYALHKQIGNQISQLTVNENHYMTCISVMKQVLSSINNPESPSDVSDID